jgi:putative SOS response-associated peptidase YedK
MRMCGRFGLTFPWEKTTRYLFNTFGVEIDESKLQLPRFNIAPTEPLLTLIHDGNRYRVGLMTWGFTSGQDSRHPVINARSETLHEKPMFRQSFFKQRCLVIGTGFYEWDRKQTPSQPYWFYASEPFIVFAGIYQVFKDEHGKKSAKVSLLTTKANALMSTIHDRLPVILNSDQYQHWVSPKTPIDELQFLFKSTNYQSLKMHLVSTAVNKASYQSKDAILPIKK